MVEGILVVNLDPPYLGFVFPQKQSGCETKRWRGALKNCSEGELKQMLLDLKAISPSCQWPPAASTVQVPGNYPEAVLARIGLESPAGQF
jgi:hypothetical protein